MLTLNLFVSLGTSEFPNFQILEFYFFQKHFFQAIFFINLIKKVIYSFNF